MMIIEDTDFFVDNIDEPTCLQSGLGCNTSADCAQFQKSLYSSQQQISKVVTFHNVVIRHDPVTVRHATAKDDIREQVKAVPNVKIWSPSTHVLSTVKLCGEIRVNILYPMVFDAGSQKLSEFEVRDHLPDNAVHIQDQDDENASSIFVFLLCGGKR